MKTKRLPYLSFICLIFLCFGCETESTVDVSQDRIYVAYGALWDEAQDLTIINVTFSLGNYNGTRLELAEGAAISFNGDAVPYTSLGYYELKLTGFVQTGTFEYIDLNGNVFQNDISIVPIAFAAGTPTVIDRSKSHEIRWDGQAVGTGQSSVVATVVPSNLGETKLFSQTAEGATSVMLTPDVLGQIANEQKGLLVLERIEAMDAMDATEAGGLVTARYRPNALDIDID